MSSAIIVSTKAAKAIKPPLKKSEIIEALAIRRHKQLVDESQEKRIQRQALEKKLHELGSELPMTAAKTRVEVDRSYTDSGWKPVAVKVFIEHRFPLGDLTPELRTVIREIDANKASGVPDIKEVRREIREAMGSETCSRVNALLADPATQKALDRTLAELCKKPAPLSVVASISQ